jgi:hypothetical protein
MAKGSSSKKKASPIRSLNLGSASAENDNSLESYFVTSWSPFQKAISFDNKNFFIKGRTGSGKSAILQKIKLEYKNTPDIVIVEISPDDFFLTMNVNLDGIKEFTQITNHPEFAYKILWNLVIAGECLKTLSQNGKDPERRIPKITSNTAYNFMKDAGLLSSVKLRMIDKVFRLMAQLKPSLKLKPIGAEIGTSVTLSENSRSIHKLLHDCTEILEDVIPQLLGTKSMYILIDDLDLGWTNDETSNLLIRSLTLCLLRIARIDAMIKPLAAIRTNIFNEIGMYQTEKISDYLIDCYWDPETVKEVIEKRFAYAYKMPQSGAWLRFFDQKMTIGQRKIDTFDYLFHHTLGRPRDMLSLVVKCLETAEKNGHSKIVKKTIETALSEFSIERAQALQEEWRYNYPNLKDVIRMLAQLDNNGELKKSYTFTELWDVLADGHRLFWDRKDICWYYSLINVDDTSPLMMMLFTIGFFGIQMAPSAKIQWVHEIENKTLSPSLKSSFHIASCFHSYMETLTPPI